MVKTYEEMWGKVGSYFQKQAELLHAACAAKMNTTDLGEMTYEDGYEALGFEFEVGDGDTEKHIDVNLVLSDSEEYEGAEDGSWQGANVTLSAVWYGGRLVFDCTPHNFTPQVWTRSVTEIRKRLKWVLESVEAIAVDLEHRLEEGENG